MHFFQRFKGKGVVKFYSGEKSEVFRYILIWKLLACRSWRYRQTRSRAAYVDLIWDDILFTPVSSKLEVYPKYTEAGSYWSISGWLGLITQRLFCLFFLLLLRQFTAAVVWLPGLAVASYGLEFYFYLRTDLCLFSFVLHFKIGSKGPEWGNRYGNFQVQKIDERLLWTWWLESKIYLYHSQFKISFPFKR